MVDFKPLLDWTGGPAFAWVVAAGLLYWLGGRRAPQARARGGGGWRAAAFVAALATIVIALDTRVDELAEELLWVHMVQHLLLLVLAPPLLALARPWNRIWHGLPLGLRRRTAGAVARSPRLAPLRRLAEALQDPLPSWLAFNVTFLLWHLPAAYDATLNSQLVHALEHATFFATALLFWTRVIDSPPWRRRLAEVPRAFYLGSAMLVSWVLAIAFAVSTAPVYAPYAAEAARPGGLTALADQQLAAGIMWVPGSIPMAIALLCVVYRWLQPKQAPSAPRRPAAGVSD